MSIDEATERRTTLSPAKQAMLAKLMRGGVNSGAPGAGAIPRLEPGAPARLSAAQQRLWFLYQMDPATAAFNIPLMLRLRGALDADALERALAEIVRRHEALRTVFASRAGTPVQQVLPPPARALSIDELPPVPVDEREAAARAWAADEANAPFDLAAHPGLRARLLRVSADEHVLVITLHHIVSDGWSTGVLYRELAALYGAFTRGEASPLPDLPIQYADYAAWQHARLARPERAREVDFWRAKLAGAPVLLDLPTDRPRPAVQDTAAAAHRFRISRELRERLSALAKAESATPFMALAAAWSALLHRWSGQDDVVVGTPLAGRTHPQAEPLIGFFVQTLALRMDLSGDPSFRALIGRVRRTTVEAYAHQEVPFDQLVDELKVERSLSHPPLFQATVALQNASGAGPELPGLRAESFAGEVRAAEGYLLLYMEEDERGLNAMLQYPTALWDAGTMERLAAQLLVLLDGAAADPETRLSRLPLLPEDERARLLGMAGGPAVADAQLPIHRTFESQAARTPDAVAVEAEDGTLTFGELDRRANRLAHHLRARGVGPETVVGLCVGREKGMMVALLAVLKAGGAYLPLDPQFPADRLGWMLADSGARVLVSRTALIGELPLDGIDTVLLDRDADEIAAHADTAPAIPDPRPSTLAYIIYTSGSTGRPKGVRVEHGAVAATMAAAGAEFRFGPGDRVAVLASFAFDIWLVESLLPLLSGARVRLFTRERVLDFPRLARDLADCTAVHAVPALIRGIVREVRAMPGGVLPGVRRACVGGDAVPPDLLEEMRQAFPAAEVDVLYGPTEAAIICTAHRLGRETASRQMLGGPLGNAALYVLEPGGSIAPVGVPGELCLGGPSVARDYLGRPALTAERFVPDPFSARPGARLYRTGDRVRWVESAEVRECVSAGVDPVCADSRTDALTHSRTHALEFLGRTDRQVKLRGFRIEPGEIEARLREHPGVAEAVVDLRADTAGERRLVAYLVPSGATAPSAAELRAHLGATLPDYMLPGAFVTLEALPLTANGKTDLRALPAPAPAPERDHVPPTTPAEETIAAIWAEALGVERVGVHDNFFEIGGHSLLVARLYAAIREAFARELALVDLFRHTTVAAQAAFVTENPDAAPAATPAQQRGTTRADARRTLVGSHRGGRR
jgi:amino acid adenylation domain-containing protein